MAPSQLPAIAKRIKEIRRLLGPWPGKLLPRRELGRRLEVDASTVKKWETAEVKIGSENALKLAKLAGCTVEWILTGDGRPPESAKRYPAQPASAKRAVHEPAHRGLTPDDIATEAGKVIAPLIERLAEKSPITAAMWLQAAAIEANRQGVNEVYDLMELAQELLRKAGHASDRSGTKTIHPTK